MQARAAVTMATASSSASTSPPRIKVKKELCADNESIKELAETAMNDILGWYGYDSVDRLPEMAGASGSSSGAIERAESVSRLKPPPLDPHGSPPSTSKAKRHDPKSSPGGVPRRELILPPPPPPPPPSHALGDHFLVQDDLEKASSSASGTAERRSGRDAPSAGHPSSPTNERNGGIVLHHQAHPHQHHPHHHPAAHLAGVPGGAGESSTSEKDSSRESSKSPMLMKMLDKQEQTCQWCRKVIPSHQPGILGTTEGMIFCTEACFSQSRRASFKRAKTCDWCRHVRHAVSYVDFQDGASQLQFCSDKCLNQYKMQIFCNETQAHLELNPHLKEKSSSAGSLITPELWMKNCKSCSLSPVSDRSESVSPVPSVALRSSPEPSPSAMLHSPTPVKKPLISVAPPSKLLSKSLQSALSRGSAKSSRKRRLGSHRPSPQTGPQQAGVSSSKRSLATLQQADYGMAGTPSNSSLTGSSPSGSNLNHAGNNNNNNNNVTIPNNNLQQSANGAGPLQPKPCTVISANVQDLRMLQKKHVPPVGFEGRDAAAMAVGSLAPPPPGAPGPPPGLNIPPQFLPPPLNLLRPPFFHVNPAHLRFAGGIPNLAQPQPPLPQPPPPPPPQPPPSGAIGPPPSPLAGVPLGAPLRPPLPGFPGLGGPPPPVTILVPYPIIVPLPLPIPIPIPVIDFLRAALPKEAGETRTNEAAHEAEIPKADGKVEKETPLVNGEVEEDGELGVSEEQVRVEQEQLDLDSPLDFTVAGKSHTSADACERSATTGKQDRSCEQTIGYARPIEEATGVYTASTSPGECDSNVKREPAKLFLPKIRISLTQETRIIGAGDGQVDAEQPGTTDGIRRPLDHDEDEMERERKEMVERSRPLRKRKRLVVQQHLEQPEPVSDGMVDEAETGSSK